MCIVKALQAQSNLPLRYRLEFWKANMLRPLLQLHPNWERFKKLLNDSSDWPLEDISESNCADNINEALTFGNHKGASSNPKLLLLLMGNNIIYGFAVQFPLEKMTNIPGILFAPLNIQEQTPSMTVQAELSHQNNSPTTRATDGPCPAHPSTAT